MVCSRLPGWSLKDHSTKWNNSCKAMLRVHHHANTSLADPSKVTDACCTHWWSLLLLLLLLSIMCTAGGRPLLPVLLTCHGHCVCCCPRMASASIAAADQRGVACGLHMSLMRSSAPAMQHEHRVGCRPCTIAACDGRLHARSTL
jgi:hypothetical protein